MHADCRPLLGSKNVALVNRNSIAFCCVAQKLVPLNADLRSLDFVIDRLLMKLFKTNKIDVVTQCQQYINFELSSVSIANRAAKFQALFHVYNSAIINNLYSLELNQ